MQSTAPMRIRHWLLTADAVH